MDPLTLLYLWIVIIFIAQIIIELAILRILSEIKGIKGCLGKIVEMLQERK